MSGTFYFKQIPKKPAPPCSDELTPSLPRLRKKLIHSIALEEMALAHLINAEAEKTQTVAKGPVTTFTPDEYIHFQRSLAEVLTKIVEKEKLLLKKLRLLLHLSGTGRRCPPLKKCQKQRLPHKPYGKISRLLSRKGL